MPRTCRSISAPFPVEPIEIRVPPCAPPIGGRRNRPPDTAGIHIRWAACILIWNCRVGQSWQTVSCSACQRASASTELRLNARCLVQPPQSAEAVFFQRRTHFFHPDRHSVARQDLPTNAPEDRPFCIFCVWESAGHSPCCASGTTALFHVILTVA